MIFKFYSSKKRCNDLILIDFYRRGWYVRYRGQESFIDKRGQPTLWRWLEENGCACPPGLSDAIEALWTQINNEFLDEETEGQKQLNLLSEWIISFNAVS